MYVCAFFVYEYMSWCISARYDKEQEMVRVLNHPEERIEMLTRNGNPNTNTEEEEDEEEDIFNVNRDR